jgi:NADH:ubiquinone oxidoreductase subunit E
MTIEALYKRIIASDELKSAFIEAVKAQKLDEFLKSQGCDAAGAEIMDFLKSLQKAEGELADDELSAVAGGCNSTEAIYSMTVAFCIGFAIMSAVDPVSENKDDWGDKLLCDI